jgi:hypothetical protein
MKRNNNVHLKIWKNHHGEISKDSDGRSYEIHHIDENHKNNNIENLQCITIHEHLEIHKKQHDWGAVQSILMRLELTQEDRNQISEMASMNQKKLMNEGRHNWQKMSKEERSELSRQIGLQSVRDKTGLHKINADPILAKENGKKAGLIAAQKNAGFLDTTSENHGSKHVKGTTWWINENGKRVRSITSPGKNWKKGMKYEG